MAKKKGLLKKIFGKSKQSKDTKNSSTSGGIANAAGGTSPVNTNPKISADVGEPVTPPAPPKANACDDVAQSDSVTVDPLEKAEVASVSKVHEAPSFQATCDPTENDDVAGDAAPDKSVSETVDAAPKEDVAEYAVPDEDVVETVDAAPAEAVADDDVPTEAVDDDAAPTEPVDDDAAADGDVAEKVDAAPKEAVAGTVDAAAEEDVAETVDDATPKKDISETDENTTGQENEAEGEEREEKDDCEGKEDGVQGNQIEAKKDRRSWAEKRMSQMYASSSAKPVEKPKLDVQFGKLSERMKAVEQALHNEKGNYSSPPKEVPPSHTLNREKAAAQRKAIEDKLRRKSEPKVLLEEKFNRGSPPGTVSAQRKAVEEMLQKDLDPKAFLDSKGKANPQSPGMERLASRKKWVLETLEKQNDPQLFINQRDMHSEDSCHENCGQKKDFEEHKKWLEGMAEHGDKGKEDEENAISATC